jgi:hypothetical protein
MDRFKSLIQSGLSRSRRDGPDVAISIGQNDLVGCRRDHSQFLRAVPNGPGHNVIDQSRRRTTLRNPSLPLVIAIAAILVLGAVAPAAAQEQTGNLFGTVKDTQGEALPGVRVEMTGIGAPRVQFTDSNGVFRFLNLDPGAYQLTASLEGFSTVEYPNVDVRVGRNTTLEVTVTPAVEEVITVTSESPLLDERKVARGARGRVTVRAVVPVSGHPPKGKPLV